MYKWVIVNMFKIGDRVREFVFRVLIGLSGWGFLIERVRSCIKKIGIFSGWLGRWWRKIMNGWSCVFG